MPEDKKISRAQHNIIMENRRQLTITGVVDIDSFDENTVIMFTDLGELTVKGEALHINRIDVEAGDLLMEGDIEQLYYTDNQPQRGGFFSKLFK